MLARTHVSIGLGALTLVAPKITQINTITHSSILSMLMMVVGVVIGSLIPDIDHPDSLLSRKLGSQLIGRILVVFLAGLLAYSNWLYLSQYWLYGFSAFMALTAIADYSMAKSFLPIVAIERAGLIIVGLGLLYLSQKFNYPFGVSIISIVFLFMGILSHRGLTHSLLGFASLSLAALFITSRYPNLLVKLPVIAHFYLKSISLPVNLLFIPLMLGMALHLLADSFADSGIPLLYPIPFRFRSPITITTGSTLENTLRLVIVFYVMVIFLKDIFLV